MKTKKPNLSRRAFLGSVGAATAGAASLGVTFSPRARAGTGNPTLVYVFLSGGMDGLSLIPPISGVDLGHYMDARDRTTIDPVDDAPFSLNGTFGLNPMCSGLNSLYQLNKLAVIQACGHPPGTHTRSHFDAQEQIELGTPGEQASSTGWLARYLQTTSLQPGAIFTALVSSSNPPVSLGGWPDIATLDSPGSFHPNSGTFGDTHLAMLRQLYGGGGSLDVAAGAAVDAVELINSLELDNYVPGGGAQYPNNSLGDDMRLIAQLIRQDLGISVATVNYGGWDDHNDLNSLNQFNGFGQRAQRLSEALHAFYTDLAGVGRVNDIAVVVQTEFGRQIKENANFGTDHGLAAPMLVIGGGVTGGVYGDFPGLAPVQRLSDSLEPTTDFRQVLAEVCSGLMGNGNIGTIFPDLVYQPLGFA